MTETPERAYYTGDATRYERATRQVAETQGNVWTERNWWRRGCLGALAVVFVLSLGLVWLGRRPAHEPVYVKVTQEGQLQIVGWDAYDPAQEEIKRDLIMVMRCIREVPTDRTALERCWRLVPLFLLEKTQARAQVGAYFARMKPDKDLFQKSVVVEDMKGFEEPDGRWRLNWREDVYEMPRSGGLGKLVSSTRQYAIVVVKRLKPKARKEIELDGEPMNPRGLRLVQLAWGE